MQLRRIEGLLSGLCGIAAVWPTMLFAVIGILVIVSQFFRWLKTGLWETITLHIALEWWAGRVISIDKFDSGLRGLDKIMHLVLDGTPLVLIVVLPLIWFTISMLVFMSLFSLIDR